MRVFEPVATVDMENYTMTQGTRVLIERLHYFIQESGHRTPFFDNKIHADIAWITEYREALDAAEQSNDDEAKADAALNLQQVLDDTIQYWVGKAEEAGYRVDYVEEQYTYAIYSNGVTRG